jgi:hypothetical protein
MLLGNMSIEKEEEEGSEGDKWIIVWIKVFLLKKLINTNMSMAEHISIRTE